MMVNCPFDLPFVLESVETLEFMVKIYKLFIATSTDLDRLIDLTLSYGNWRHSSSYKTSLDSENMPSLEQLSNDNLRQHAIIWLSRPTFSLITARSRINIVNSLQQLIA